MPDEFPKDFRILIFGLSDLPTDIFGKAIVRCSDYEDLKNALRKYRLSKKFIACDSEKLIELDILLLKFPFDTLYVLNKEDDNDIREWLNGLLLNNVIEVQNTKQLMRRLCTTIMLCYYYQSIEYRNGGNHGLANLSVLDSLKALDYSTNFI